jgi:fructosamine-3-kinase
MYNKHMDIPQKKIIDDVVASVEHQTQHIEPIVGHGSVNQIFIVTTDKGKLVIRLNNDRGFDEFVKEKWCIEMAAAWGVKGPKVLKIGEMDNHSFMVQSYLEGVVGSLGDIDKTAVWEEIGRYAKLIHSIPVSGFGLASSELFSSESNTSHEKWKRFVRYNIESLTPEDKLLGLGALSEEQSQKVKKLLEELIQKQFVFGLNHGDLSLKNVIVSLQNEVNIFDWGSAEAQIIPHHDIGEILKASLKSDSPEFKSFVKGYGLSEEEYAKLADDIHSLMLLRSIDKLRWAIDKNQVAIPESITRVKEFYKLKFN